MKKNQKTKSDQKMQQDHTKKMKLIMCVLLAELKKKNPKPLGYKEVQEKAKKINIRLGTEMQFHFILPKLLGDLNRHIQGYPPKKPIIPTITAIVINQLKKVPGADIEGFPGFKNYREADKSKQRKMTEKEQNKVYDYGYSEWKKIYTDLFC